MILSLDHVQVRYQGRLVADDLHFLVAEGEHWAILGSSNSDGSVLLDTIAGRYHVTSGIRRLHFDPDHSDFGGSRRIGYVAAHYHFRNLSNTTSFYYQQRYNGTGEEDAVTVGEYLFDVEQGAATAGARPWKFDRLVARMRLGQLMEKQLIFLSNGETRRVMIAASLLRNPVLLLLDHPLTGLDVETRSDFNVLISEVVASGIHVIVSTKADEIPDAVTHVAVMKNRKVVSTSPRALFDPDTLPPPPLPSIDAGELRALVPARHERYNVVVGMKNIHVQYGDQVILDDVTWEVRQGEHWSLRGHNGAGKSTLLSLINGDNPQAYSNQIVLFDQPKGPGMSIWSLRKKVGYVSPELFRYFPTGHSCLDVVESGFYDTLGLFRKNDPEKRVAIDRWLRLLGIPDVADKKFDQVPFSAQRLCLLARALVKGPVLLILDEPCEGLDIVQQRHFVHLIDEVCRHSDVTLIYVSHYQDQIPACVDKSIQLSGGRVVSAS